ncbi:ABC transporter substrate-binding protein [Oceanidesulfovibrio marinus]|nr:ABC transporter substrate-binding protein [Oceanidesulfovibrio marinus]
MLNLSGTVRRRALSAVAICAAFASVLMFGANVSTAHAAKTCPAATVADDMGITGEFPEQYELSEFTQGGCEMAYAENPEIAKLNAEITGNPDLPPVAERLPREPLVIAPYEAIGTYGGVLHGLSKGTESGTSDLLSIRHVNLVRYADDLKTVVPNVAKSWSWNDDYTVLTFTLRKGHKWSDGEPFTAEDVAFWYNDLILNPDVYEKTPDRWLFDGKPMKVEATDETTVVMTFPVPSPGILNRFAVDFGQPFQPKHFLKQFMPKYNPDAATLAKEKGLKDAAELLSKYYSGSDWKDVPTPLLSGFDTQVVPTLEAFIVVADTATGRRCVANPYFHMVDTAGNQLPYINVIDEQYVKDKEVQNLKITNGEVTFKEQAIFIEDYPLLKDNESKGDYAIDLAPTLGENIFYAFNTTDKDEELRKIFNDLRFRQAMSVAINRDEINELVFFGQGVPMQATPAEPETVNFVSDENKNAFIEYDPAAAKELLAGMGLKDSDGDGILERFDGKPLVVRLIYSNQGAPVKIHELVRDYWGKVGVRIDLKEVTSDEYRAAANNNDLDLTTWKNDGSAAPAISQDVTAMIPPFGDYFNPGTGFGWAAWKTSDGKDGIEPPAEVMELYKLTDKFLQQPIGTPGSDAIGKEIVDIHVKNLWKIGTVGNTKGPVMHSNSLGNFHPFKAKSYDYYWTYPYRGFQWFIKK